MTPQRWHQIEDLCRQALDRDPAEQFEVPFGDSPGWRDLIGWNRDGFETDPCERSYCPPGAFGIHHHEDLLDTARLKERSDAQGLIPRRVAF